MIKTVFEHEGLTVIASAVDMRSIDFDLITYKFLNSEGEEVNLDLSDNEKSELDELAMELLTDGENNKELEF